MFKYPQIVIFCSILLFIVSCAKDATEPVDTSACNTSDVSFELDVLPILETSCSYEVSCHSTGSANGGLNNYNEILPYLEDGKFNLRVLVNKDMPPIYAEDGRPKELMACELEQIAAWYDAGYPNN